MNKSWFKHRIILIYTIISGIVFNSIYETSKSVIDELFHVEQGLNYCYGFYHEWNPKITTLPGLYLLTLFTPRCSLFNLRLIPFVCSVINFYLIYAIRSIVMSNDKNDKGRLKILLDATSLIILPSMYFFSFVFYSDVPSVTSILLMLFFSLKGKYQMSSIFAFFSVLMRQTNIVWVAGIFGAHIADHMTKEVYPKMKLEESKLSHFLNALTCHLKSSRLMISLILHCIKTFYGYAFVILAFIVFLVKNGSIVVGDKSAHEATIHIPQFFYFSIFTLVFGFSMWFPQVINFIKSLRKSGFLFFVILIGLAMAVIVHFNTIVHPYLLADNRHYTFYVWHRLYARHALMRYLLIPVYIFGLYVICKALNGSIGFKLFYFISTTLTFCLQGLIEVRYFLIPFVVLRLFRRDIIKKWTFIELLISLLINYVTLKVFHTIQIKWPDFDEPQRIIW